MPLVIPDEALKAASLTEQEARLGFACHLFETGKLCLWPAAQLAGLTRDEFWAELLKRGIPAFTITDGDSPRPDVEWRRGISTMDMHRERA